MRRNIARYSDIAMGTPLVHGRSVTPGGVTSMAGYYEPVRAVHSLRRVGTNEADTAHKLPWLQLDQVGVERA